MKAGLLAGRQATASAGPGHPGIAAWVAANTSDVIGYWPLSDAAASATMNDSGPNNLDGTYGAGVGSTTIDGETVGNFDGVAGDQVTAPNSGGTVMNANVAGFCVVKFDSLSGFRPLPARDGGVGSNRAYQWRTNGTEMEFVKIPGGVVTIATSGLGLSTATSRYTLGWWWDGSTLTMYVNGSSVTSGALTGAGSLTSSNGLEIAFSTGGAMYLDGACGSVLLLSAANSSTIADLHDAWVNGYP